MTEQKNNKEDASFGQKSIQSRYIMIRENIYQLLSSHALSVYMSLRYEGDYASEAAPVKRNIKCLCNKARVSRSRCFEALNELEEHGLLRRNPDPGYQSMYLVAQDLGYFLPKQPEEIPPVQPQESVDLPPVQDVDEVVQDVDGVVQDVDDIIINSFHQSSHLKPIVDSESTKPLKEYEADLLFMAFYSIYPHKQKPSIARAMFYKVAKKLKLTPQELLEVILEDLPKRIENNWAGRDKSKIPFPATYLNTKEWEGDIEKPRSNVSPIGRPRTRTLEELNPGVDLSQVEFL